MRNEKYDCIIVGAGLAGCSLYLWLKNAGLSVLLIDSHQQGASHIAAGIVNPLTGRNLVKTWMCDTIIPFSKAFYRDAEIKLNSVFFHDREIAHFYHSTNEENDLFAKSADPAYQQYLKLPQEIKPVKTVLNNSVYILQGGYLDIDLFLKKVIEHAKQQNAYKNALFDWHELKPDKSSAIYRNISTHFCIDCTGMGVLKNPYFKDLPISPLKGEILHAKINTDLKNQILHKNVFVFQHHDGDYRIASTYESTPQNNSPSKEAKQELLKKAAELISEDIQIKEHLAGYRPTVIDRRPVVGLHHAYPSIGILNGFGSKGVTLAPWAAFQLTRHLLYKNDFHPEMTVERFFSMGV